MKLIFYLKFYILSFPTWKWGGLCPPILWTASIPVITSTLISLSHRGICELDVLPHRDIPSTTRPNGHVSSKTEKKKKKYRQAFEDAKRAAIVFEAERLPLVMNVNMIESSCTEIYKVCETLWIMTNLEWLTEMIAKLTGTNLTITKGPTHCGMKKDLGFWESPEIHTQWACLHIH